MKDSAKMNKSLFKAYKLIELDVIDSTNNYAAKLLDKTKNVDGTVIMAYFQSEGKGQRDASWQSEPGANLLFSAIVDVSFLTNKTYFLLSKIVAIAINETIEEITNNNSFIKWPNDIIIDNKKIAGILIENIWKGSKLDTAIIGVGLNVNQINFNDNKNITSLSLLTSKTYILKDLLNNILEKLSKLISLLKDIEIDEIQNRYNNHLLFLDQWKVYTLADGKKIEGKIIKVRLDGLLVIETKNKSIINFDFKEINLL